MSSLDASKSAATIADYDAVAAAFDAGNRDHDVSQNIDALLEPIAAERPIIVDLGCAGGRDLVALTARGCEAWGVEGSPTFCALARRAAPGCTVLEQDFVDMDLPAERFDGAFANASLFHVPSESLPEVLRRIFESLKPGGVFFASNAHGFGEDKEGWTDGRTPATRSWVCWLSEATWRRYCEAAGFTFLHSYYRGSSKAFLATVWRKKSKIHVC
jgi:SAM-dependent methyltransferase